MADKVLDTIELVMADVSGGKQPLKQPESVQLSPPVKEPEHPWNPPEKLSYKTVDGLIKTVYNDPNTMRSTALDILAIYLKGQKILYTESKTFCERRLYTLIVPATVITAACTMLSIQLKDYEYGSMIVSILNAVNSLLLTLVTLLKLDAKAEAHKISAYKFDKLQAYCEFKSGKILFMNDEQENVMEIIDEIENKVKEIKETNQFILPERIRYTFRMTYGQNVFSTVKEIQSEEMMLTNHLKGIINALITLHAASSPNQETILDLERKQNVIIDRIIMLRDKYLNIDKMYEHELAVQVNRVQRDWACCLKWLNT